MRDCNNEKTLILGYKNSPFLFGTSKIDKKYNKKHLHANCYTINPDIGMNPYII